MYAQTRKDTVFLYQCMILICVFIYTGVLQLMEIGDVQRKDIMDHPENYTLLTTLDEGLLHDVFL